MGYWVTLRDDGTPTAFSGLEMSGAVWVDVDHITLETCRLVDGVWVPREPELEPEPEPQPKGWFARLLGR